MDFYNSTRGPLFAWCGARGWLVGWLAGWGGGLGGGGGVCLVGGRAGVELGGVLAFIVQTKVRTGPLRPQRHAARDLWWTESDGPDDRSK